VSANQNHLSLLHRLRNAPKRERTVNARLEEVSILAPLKANSKTFSEVKESRTLMLLRKS
jgi:hypothetical protein